MAAHFLSLAMGTSGKPRLSCHSSMEIHGIRAARLEGDLGPQLLHEVVEGMERPRELGVEVVIVEHAAHAQRPAALPHEVHGELLVAGTLAGPATRTARPTVSEPPGRRTSSIRREGY
jgi:hypothetical protein